MARRKTIPITKLRDFYNILRILSPLTQEAILRDFLKRADIVTGDDLKALKNEIRELKKMISRDPEA